MAKITDIRHPEYTRNIAQWNAYRQIQVGGKTYKDALLKRFADREIQVTFDYRKSITYVPGEAKAAVNEVRDGLCNRLNDVIRRTSIQSFELVREGEMRGVNLEGSSMTHFMGQKVLTELLFMGKVGIMVDRQELPVNPSKADTVRMRPYMYVLTAEQILAWDHNPDFSFRAILIETATTTKDEITGLPNGSEKSYRLFEQNGAISVRDFNANGELVKTSTLDLAKIPIAILEISHSLLADTYDHQNSLLQLASADMIFLIQSNFPLYTEQFKPGMEQFSKMADDPDELNTGTGEAAQAIGRHELAEIGTTTGRRYTIGTDRPDFIAPSPDHVTISLEKQKDIIESIRRLTHLSLLSVKGTRASAESRQEDRSGLESGAYSIAMELRNGEVEVLEIWAQYEGLTAPSIVISYPRDWRTLTETDRRQEAEEYLKQAENIHTMSAKKLLLINAITVLLAHKLKSEDLNKIVAEIEAAPFVVIDRERFLLEIQAGLLTTETGSITLGYPAGEAAKAEDEHQRRLERVAISQSKGEGFASKKSISQVKQGKEFGNE